MEHTIIHDGPTTEEDHQTIKEYSALPGLVVGHVARGQSIRFGIDPTFSGGTIVGDLAICEYEGNDLIVKATISNLHARIEFLESCVDKLCQKLEMVWMTAPMPGYQEAKESFQDACKLQQNTN